MIIWIKSINLQRETKIGLIQQLMDGFHGTAKAPAPHTQMKNWSIGIIG